MRLDKYLKVSRLIKRRTVANEACDNGRISVNGKVAKAGYEVKIGDRIEITLGERTVAVECCRWPTMSVRTMPAQCIKSYNEKGVYFLYTPFSFYPAAPGKREAL